MQMFYAGMIVGGIAALVLRHVTVSLWIAWPSRPPREVDRVDAPRPHLRGPYR